MDRSSQSFTVNWHNQFRHADNGQSIAQAIAVLILSRRFRQLLCLTGV
jgi:hypothetical protein